ncbi:hypothetical protein NG767_05315 [Aliarcobacter cryaerophilus]
MCHPVPMTRAFLNAIKMKINRVELIKNAQNYKCIVGAILNKEKEGSFLVKTKDSFIRIIDFEYNGKFKVGDRFDVK